MGSLEAAEELGEEEEEVYWEHMVNVQKKDKGSENEEKVEESKKAAI